MSVEDIAKQTSVSILVVEDDENHRELIAEAIRGASVSSDVVCVENGEKALRYLHGKGEYSDKKEGSIPDLILLDIRLPGMNGKQVLAVIKSHKRTRVIPVIMLTASAHNRDVEECYSVGASGYIVKPISFDEFTEIVKGIPYYWAFVNAIPGRDPRSRRHDNRMKGNKINTWDSPKEQAVGDAPEH
ncbi:MAG: response regulator [Thermoplasmata archaeon]|nr:response regulator [Thermoplasmata archaeon]